MSNRELRLKYQIELASNLAAKGRAEATAFEEANRRMTKAVATTEKGVAGLEKQVDQVGPKTLKQAQTFEDASRRMSTAMGRTERSAAQLDNRLRGLASNTSMERQVAFVDRLAQGYERAASRASQLKQAVANGLDRAPEVAMQVGAGYVGARTLMAPPIRAYSDLESATTDLRVAMLKAKNKVDGSFPAILAEAETLGGKLPGTTKDFIGAATALVQQGTPGDVIAGGGLRAASNFSVLMNMNPAEGAETIAKVREAYGLKGDQLPAMADLMQRGRFAFGINPQDFRAVANYAAPTYNSMSLTGLDNAKRLMAVQGMAASVGLESSSFGTNFSQMLSRISQIDGRTGRKSAEAKAVREALAEHGIEMSFYNKDGEFSGIENMLTELTKLRKLSTLDRQKTLNLMFGAEAGRPAQIMADQGIERYRENLQKIDEQADLDARITMKMDTFASKLEALGGAVEGAMARMAAPVGTASKPFIDLAGDAAGGMSTFFEAHPGWGTAATLGLGGAGLYGAVRGYGALSNVLKGRLSGGAASPATAGGTGAMKAAPAVYRTGGPLLGDVMKAQAAAKSASRVAFLERYLGRLAPTLMTGLESWDVITDDKLTTVGKARGVTGAVAGGVGGWYGAGLGAAAGTAVAPGVGTLLGGIAGGALGYFGGKGAIDALWSSKPERDLVRLTDPRGASLGSAQAGGETTVQIGEGRLQLDVRVTDERTSVTSLVTQPMPLLRVDAGSTDPGSFNAGLQRGGY